MRRRLSSIALMLAVAGALTALHWELREQRRLLHELRAVECAPVDPGPRFVASTVTLGDADLERIARRVVALSSTPVSAPPREAAGAPAPEPPSAEQNDAARRASDHLARAIAQGRLTRQDVEAMREALAGATQDERRELTRQLMVAINTQRLQLEDAHFVIP